MLDWNRPSVGVGGEGRIAIVFPEWSEFKRGGGDDQLRVNSPFVMHRRTLDTVDAFLLIKKNLIYRIK